MYCRCAKDLRLRSTSRSARSWTNKFPIFWYIFEMNTNQQTVVHDSLLFQKLTVPINLPEITNIYSLCAYFFCWGITKQFNFNRVDNISDITQCAEIFHHLQNSWNQDFCSRNMKFRSRSLRIVVSLISDSGLIVIRPSEEPFKSKRLWMVYSEQKRLPIMINRTCKFKC